MSLTLVLHRVFHKGAICFELPRDPAQLESLKKILTSCRDKHGDFVKLVIDRPAKPRTTGDGSQSHHLNGHIAQICNETGSDFEAIKYTVKMIAVEQFDYPFTTCGGHVLPKPEHESTTAECAKLIEAAHYLASELNIILMEG